MRSMDFGHPFSTFNSDPAYTGDFNGATGMIMQSQMDADNVIEATKEYIDMGYHPNIAVEKACKDLRVKSTDIFNYDINRIEKEIERYCRTKF